MAGAPAPWSGGGAVADRGRPRNRHRRVAGNGPRDVDPVLFGTNRMSHGLAEIVPDIGAALWVVDLDVQATHLASEASEPRRQSVQKPAWSDRLCLQIVILFLSNGRVISLAPPAGRVPCRSIIRITRHLAMPNFCGMRVVAFPTGMIGCKAVSKMGIAYVSSVHYRSYAAAAASIRRTEWNDGLLGSLFLSFRQRDPCGRGSEFFPARQQLMWFNDDDQTSHADVMALFDRAIDRSTAQAFISL